MNPKIKMEQTDEQANPEEIMPEAASVGTATGAPSKSKGPWLVLAVVIIILGLAGFAAKDKLRAGFMWGSKGEAVSGYQAVFLSNGQVYFGKLSDVSDTYVTLRDIYYLQVVQQQQQLQGQQAVQAGQSPQVSLVKLGNELHGPADVMKINRSQILFYEDLKQDSQVVRAIRDYVQKPQAPAAPAVQPPAAETQPQPQPVNPSSATDTPVK